MSSTLKTVFLGVFALATVVLGVFVFQLRQQLHELEQNAVAERDSAQKRIAQTEQRVATAESSRATLETELKSLRARPAGNGGGSAPRQRDAANSGMAALDNPAVQKMMASSMKASLDQRYAALFRKLKLSPAALDKLKDLLTEKQMSGLDVLRASQGQGLGPAEMATLMGKMQGEMDESIHGLLGDEGFTKFQEFNQNSGSYAVLDQVERRLSYTNAPLQEAQSEALLRVLKETSESKLPTNPGGSAMAALAQSFGGSNPMVAAMTQPRITDRTISAAQSVLTTDQIEVLKQLQAEQQKQASAMQSMRGAVGGSGSTSTTISIPAPPAGSTPPPKPPGQ